MVVKLFHTHQVRETTMILNARTIAPLKLAVATLSLAACGGQGADSTTAENAVTDFERLPERQIRVVGGEEVTGNQYPWMAAILERGTNASQGQFCGGSLISSRWILTAAHCFENDRGNLDLASNKVSVLLGRQDLTENGGETINVSRILVHPDYRANGYPDIALLELNTASQAEPIQLPSRHHPVPNVGESATVTGWGQVSENGNATNELLETAMPVVGHQQCNTAYDGDIVEDAMVCAGTADGSGDSCYGDSGGPLFVSRNNEFIQAGIVSFGEACGLPGVPGVYTRVSSYHDWITAYTGVNSFDSSSSSDQDATTTQNPITQDSAITASCDALQCTFSANSGNALDFYWDFGDGYGDEGASVTYQYDLPGTYTVVLGTIALDGDYTESTISITAKRTTGGTEQYDRNFDHNGRLNGWGDQIDLPIDQETLKFSAGRLDVQLSIRPDRRAMVYIDKYDPETGEWREVASKKSRRGESVIEIDIEAGEYGLTVLSLGRGTWYELSATVQ